VKPVITKDVPDGLGMVTLQKERIMKNKLWKLNCNYNNTIHSVLKKWMNARKEINNCYKEAW
jgi:hypothetical protein